MSDQTLWQQMYQCLKNAGLAVYTPGQHQDYCQTPYCVVSEDRVTPAEETAAGYATLTVTALVPVDQYSALEDYVQSVQQALSSLDQTVHFTGGIAYEVDQYFQAHKATLTYRSVRPTGYYGQEGMWITGIVRVELAAEDETQILHTASQCTAQPVFSQGEEQVLRSDGKTVAWLPPEDVVVGYRIVLQDLTMTPAALAMAEGGQVTQENGQFSSYQSPDALKTWTGKEVSLRILTQQKDSLGRITGYLRLTFPCCQGQAVSFSWRDGVFWSPSYTFLSRGKSGEGAYTIESFAQLPEEGEN